MGLLPGSACGDITAICQARAQQHGADIAFRFLTDRQASLSISYSELDLRARAIAAQLQSQAQPGDRVLLLYPPGLDFITGFMGCLYAGLIAVPLYPPRSRQGLFRSRAIIEDCCARLVLSSSAAQEAVVTALSALPSPLAEQVLASDRFDDGQADWWMPPSITPATPAFIQYTSGSTGEPKGVVIDHGCLMANQAAIAAAFQTSRADVCVSWLPLYHDMGLIGTFFGALYQGFCSVLMSPLSFIRRPRAWLEAISQFRATLSGGPNFAFDLCRRKVPAELLADLDLSCWRVAFNGAEPVRAQTLQAFAVHFAACGFRREALFPCYGMAEATLFISGGMPGHAPRLLEVAVDSLAEGRVQSCTPQAASTPLVSCGSVAAGHSLRIVDPHSRQPLGEGQVGEIWFAGPSVARGYFQRPVRSARDFEARLAGCEQGPFLRSGDLGFLHEGLLFVTGRLKDLIILRGRNFYPQDLERVVADAHPAFAADRIAAFSVEVDGEVRLVVSAEYTRAARAELVPGDLRDAARAAIAEHFELNLHELVLLRPGRLPVTSSGKVRRNACREAFLQDAPQCPSLPHHEELPLPSAAELLALPKPAECLAQGLLPLLANACRRPLSDVHVRQPLVRLGLDSLAAISLLQRLELAYGVSLDLEMLLDGRDLMELCQTVIELYSSGSPAAAVPDSRSRFPATANQRALWLFDRLHPEHHAYLLAHAFAFEQAPEPARLRQAIARLLARHDALRSVFVAEGDTLDVQIEDAVPELSVCDARAWSEAELAVELAQRARQPMRLDQGPLLRFHLFLREDRGAVLQLCIHHIVCDLFSILILFDELLLLLDDPQAPLPAPARSFSQHALELNIRLEGSQGQQARAYWKDLLAAPLPRLELPADHPRPSRPDYAGATLGFQLDPSLSQQARSFAAASGSTLNTLLLSCFQALLWRYCGQDELIVGVPASGRLDGHYADTVGYMVNPLPLRCQLSRRTRLSELVAHNQRAMLAGLRHQLLPLQSMMSLADEESPQELFSVMFALQQAQRLTEASALLLPESRAEVRLRGHALRAVPFARGVAQFELALHMADPGEGQAILGSLEYATSRFESATAARFTRHFQNLLRAALAQPDQPLSRLDFLDGDERRALCVSCNEQPDSASLMPLHGFVLDQAIRTPERCAIECFDDGGVSYRLDYGQLAHAVCALAERLIEAGAAADCVVGLHLGSGPAMVIGLLAISCAGAICLPLDPRLPVPRLRHMVGDAGAALLIAERVAWFDGPTLPVDPAARPTTPLPARVFSPQQGAYLMYTSGSSGTPKGVSICHGSIANRIVQAQAAFPLVADDRFLQLASIGFDIAIWECIAPLQVGATLVLGPPGLAGNPGLLAASLHDARISAIHFVPSLLRLLLEEAAFAKAPLRLVFCGGEALTPALQARFLERCQAQIHHFYGPTEATISVTSWDASESRADGLVPIGTPIGSTAIYLLDQHGNPVPQGQRGEIFMGGACLARGYWGKPALTAERFLPSPFASLPGQRLYRSGDVARRLADGQLLFEGRVDRQVKLRGFRVEPGEVERVLLSQAGVREALVVPDRERARLLAFVLPDQVPELWPSIGEYPVYDSLIYRGLSDDQLRNERYQAAMRNQVVGKSVIDIGTGAEAIQARLCIEAGAAKVFAIEINEEAARRARETVERLGLSDRIHVIHGDARSVSLPQPADVCVSEIVETLAGAEGAASILAQARRLLVPGGRFIPSRARTFIAATELPESLHRDPAFSATAAHYVDKIFAFNQAPFDLRVGITRFPPSLLLSEGAVFEDLVFDEGAETHFSRHQSLTVSRDGRLDGFLLWLYLDLDESVTLDALHQHTTWYPLFLPAFYPGLEVNAGERFEIVCRGRLREGSIYPDYALQGKYFAQDGSVQDFGFGAPYGGSGFKNNAFHARLFDDDGRPRIHQPRRLDGSSLRTALRRELPEYMVPAHIAVVDDFPLTPNGKVDVAALLATSDPETVSPIPDSEGLSATIAEIWAEVLGRPRVDIHANFFDLGGHSLQLASAHQKLEQRLGRSLPFIDLFAHPTVAALAAHLGGDAAEPTPSPTHRQVPVNNNCPIAVIGYAGRFPGAECVDQFWDNLCQGKESIAELSEEVLMAAGVPPQRLRDPHFVPVGAHLADVDLFDAAHFGYAPGEAESIDPQQRLLLECAWSALEHAGYHPTRHEAPIGVFAGANLSTYLLKNLAPSKRLMADQGDFQMSLRNSGDFVATRISYKLDLEGPAIDVQSACSTSLVAVHLAVRDLQAGACHMALAGGVSLMLPRNSGYSWQAGMIFSPDGHCRPFDAAAAGTVTGDGLGLVVLKRLEDAQADRDTIHGVILGSATNNDGARKVGFTAPAVSGQKAVIEAALRCAAVSADQIGYVEAHGTGTPMGDPIEIQALKAAFSTMGHTGGPTAIGSLKSNVGHLNTAAGVAGLLKALLAVKHGDIPATLHFQEANPRLGLADSPFFVTAERSSWPREGRRFAGVSSFGIGGTNAHVVLAEAPPEPAPVPHGDGFLLPVSARSEAALAEACRKLASWCADQPELDLDRLAFTLQVGRAEFAHRTAIVCRDGAEAARLLADASFVRCDHSDREVVFLFPGQGSQHVDMARDLYEQDPRFAQRIDRCAAFFTPLSGRDFRQVLYPDAALRAEADALLQDTRLSQACIFSVSYALAMMWLELGLQPRVMLGHSIGEYVAAHLAGVFSLEEALSLVAERGRLMADLPMGAMLSVDLSAAQLQPRLGDGLSLAAINGPNLCAVAGTPAAIEALATVLAGEGIGCRPLHVNRAFHSHMLDPILVRFRDHVASLTLRPPTRPFISSLTGEPITAEQATDPSYWVRHMRETVQFERGLHSASHGGNPILLEVGPGTNLMSLANRMPELAALPSVATLAHPKQGRPAQLARLDALARLWCEGAAITWKGLYPHGLPGRIPLPTYPFQRERYWVEAPREVASQQVAAEPSQGMPERLPRISQWFHLPGWQRCLPPSPVAAEPGLILLLGDASPFIDELCALLCEAGQRVVSVAMADTFAQVADDRFQLAPDNDDHFRQLLVHTGRPVRVIHAFSLSPLPCEASPEAFLRAGFLSLLALARSLAGDAGAVRLDVLTQQVWEVSGAEELQPLRATILGACRVIAQEYDALAVRQLDLDVPRAQRVFDQLFDADPPVRVALRGSHRLIPSFEPAPIERVAHSQRIRPGGTYWITGGLGGIGLVLAGELARYEGVKLILSGRSRLPEPHAWDDWLASHPSHDKTSLTLHRLRALQQQGAQVFAAQADVADPAAMARVKEEALLRFGPIHGVIHAAGVAAGGLIALKSAAEVAATLAPKVAGTRVLDALLDDQPLDFMLLCSSMSAVLGGFGQADYCAANAFLDAFAHARNARGKCTISVNWDAWQDVGMAALAADRAVDGFAEPAAHPLLVSRVRGAGERIVCQSELSEPDHWVLHEHRVWQRATVPGTAYLELLRAAFSAEDFAPFALSDLTLLHPLVVRDGLTRRVRTCLEPEGNGFRCTITSLAQGEEQLHASASIAPLPASVPPMMDRAALMARCNREERLITGKENLHEGFIEFGPRWDVLKQVYLGEDEGLARLQLPDTFLQDLEHYVLHPALLDAATGFMAILGEGSPLPFAYGSLAMYAPLPPSFYSYVRPAAAGEADPSTRAFDVTLFDEQGNTLVDIKRFTVKTAYPSEPMPARARLTAGSFQRALLEDGLSPEEGAEVFRRILSRPVPQILVSTHPVEALARFQDQHTRQALAELRHPSADSHERPELDVPFIAPRSALERQLAEIWQSLLGIRAIGIHDSLFALGGDSLLATRIGARVREELGFDPPIARFFEQPTIAALAALIEGDALSAGPPPLSAYPGDDAPPLSFAQTRLWFIDRLEGPNAAYNMPAALDLDGVLDEGALVDALSEIVARHEPLRTTFSERDGKPVGVIAESAPVPVPRYDLCHLPVEEQRAIVEEHIEAEVGRCFDLCEGPLLRASLLQLGPRRHLLLINMHHIAVDGWSLTILVRELSVLYEAFSQGMPSPLMPLPFRYGDFAFWQRSWLRDEVLVPMLAFWRGYLADAPPLLELPTDRPRPPVLSMHGAQFRLVFPATLSRSVRALSQRSGTTLYTALLAAFGDLLSRYSAQYDLVLGSPIANRNREELDGMIGMFANTLALRLDLSGDPRVAQLLERTARLTREAFAHQDLPFERLVDAADVPRSLSYNPLFQVFFVLLNVPRSRLQLGDLCLSQRDLQRPVSRFDLTLMIEEGDALDCLFEYNSDLFDEATIAAMARHYQQLLEAWCADEQRAIGELSPLNEEERQQLARHWNETGLDTAPIAIADLFAQQVARTPDAPALCFAGEDRLGMTYGELAAAVYRVAWRLRHMGAGPDSLVAIGLERAPALIIGLLATIEAGAAFLPLDLNLPEDRLALMMTDSGASFLLTSAHLSLPVRAPHTLLLDRAGSFDGDEALPAKRPPALTSWDHLAYMIYTSGSTGRPKGVAVTRGLAARLITWHRLNLREQRRTLQFASISFDVSFQEIYATLVGGGELVLIDRHTQRDFRALARVVIDFRVQRLFVPFAILQQLAEAILALGETPAPGFEVITAGEQLRITPALKALFGNDPTAALHNHYGPTETHLLTVHLLDDTPEQWPTLPPVGQAAAGVRVYLLDRAGRPVPIGAPGELYASAYARGYWNRPSQTAERFVPDPFSDSPGARLYRTGDLARYRPGSDGAPGPILFLGRIDTQVKLNGFRIEPGEIESVLEDHPAITRAVVLVREVSPGQRRLVAWFECSPEGKSLELDQLQEALRGHVRDLLPAYMMPASLIPVEAWPVTHSGKLDHKALPAPGELQADVLEPPRSDSELRLAQIWCELLQLDQVGIHQNFFEIGGHSLLVTQAISRIEAAFAVSLTPRFLFEQPTIAALAARIDDLVRVLQAPAESSEDSQYEVYDL